MCFCDQDSNVKVIRELRTEIQRLKSIIASGDLVRICQIYIMIMLHSPAS